MIELIEDQPIELAIAFFAGLTVLCLFFRSRDAAILFSLSTMLAALLNLLGV